MIIWTSAIESDKKIEFDHMGIRSWRSVIEISWFSIEWRRELKYEKNNGADWRQVESKSIAFERPWRFKSFHAWYDGPHCGWDIGFLHIYWPRDNCNKCWGEVE